MRKLVMLLLFVSGVSIAQNQKNLTIRLEHFNAIILHSEVKIEVSRDSEMHAPYAKISKYSKSDKKITTRQVFITEKVFNEIYKSVLEIKPRDVIKDFQTVLDGRSTHLGIYSENGSFIYYVDAIEAADKKSPYSGLKQAVVKILNATGEKIRGLN